MKATNETLSGLDPAYLAAKEKLTAGKISKRAIPRRQYGRTKETLSIIGFGGMVVKDVTPKQAANFVAEAVDRGVNYFDVAPFYGNAQTASWASIEALPGKMLLGLQDPGTRCCRIGQRNSISPSSCSRPTTSTFTSFMPLATWRRLSRLSALAVRWKRS